jgi:hypothetical protein
MKKYGSCFFYYYIRPGVNINKIACPTKNEPQQGISYLEREREGVREIRG